MKENSDNLLEANEREILVSRIINASREKVFDAWVDPDKVVKWWGPRGFTNTNIEMNVTPGGKWRYTMHGLDGTDFPNVIVYTEVKPPELLVYEHKGEGDFADIAFKVRVTFETEGGKTRVTMRSIFKDPAVLKKVAEEYGAIEGAKQNLERLSEFTERGNVIS